MEEIITIYILKLLINDELFRSITEREPIWLKILNRHVGILEFTKKFNWKVCFVIFL